MSHVSSTAHYNLPIYGDVDIINPLTDFNDCNNAIDNKLYEIAQGTASAVTDITDVKNQLGSETLDTTSQTVTGAVNELKAGEDALDTRIISSETDVATLQAQMATATTNISNLGTSVAGLQTEMSSKADASTVSALADTVATKADASSVGAVQTISEGAVYSSSPDGTKTFGQLAQEAIDNLLAVCANNVGKKIAIESFLIIGIAEYVMDAAPVPITAGMTGFNRQGLSTEIDAGNNRFTVNRIYVSNFASLDQIVISSGNVTVTSQFNDVATGSVSIYYHINS